MKVYIVTVGSYIEAVLKNKNDAIERKNYLLENKHIIKAKWIDFLKPEDAIRVNEYEVK